jgi:acyl-homoserine lactone acylase PvdQ
VKKEDDQHYLAARVSNLYELRPLRQALEMSKARNLAEFRQALSLMQLPFMNVLYADREGNIFYLYDGVIPRRDPQFQWSKPVDGADPRTEWQGFFTLDELPQLLNPRAGYIQNCNSSPFTTTHLDNPDRSRFPTYMIEDRDDDKRRAKRSREILQSRDDWTFQEVQQAAFDTTLYWAKHEMPQLAAGLEPLRQKNAQLAQQVEPLLAHLQAWDGRITADSTAATLATAWYEELYGTTYPGETLKPQYVNDPAAKLEALLAAARTLQTNFGDWRVAWGDIYRLRRQSHMADVLEISHEDTLRSLACLGGYGPMGVIFTEYYTPVVNLPFVLTLSKHYGVLGASYLAVYEFGDRVRGASVVNFGENSDPTSPHYFDQAVMMSQGKMKPELFHWDDVLAGAASSYHPGDR